VVGEDRVVGYPSDDDGEQGAGEQHVTRLLAGYALGALDPDETERVARHLARCEACRSELAEYEDVTRLLAYAAPPRPVPVRARAGLLTRVSEIGTTNQEQMIVLQRPERSRGFLGARQKTVASLPRYAMFAAVPLVLILGIVLVMGEIILDQQEELRAAQAEKNDGNRVLVNIDDPRYMTEFVTIPDAGGNARGRVLIDREANTAMIVAIDLPQLEAGQHLVAWFRFHDPHEYARAGVLQIDDQQRSQLIIEPVSPIGTYESLVITIETDAETALPSGPEIMTAGMYPENLQVVP
jgi:hypothetical protein